MYITVVALYSSLAKIVGAYLERIKLSNVFYSKVIGTTYKTYSYLHLPEKLIKLIFDTFIVTMDDEKLKLIIVGLMAWTIRMLFS